MFSWWRATKSVTFYTYQFTTRHIITQSRKTFRNPSRIPNSFLAVAMILNSHLLTWGHLETLQVSILQYNWCWKSWTVKPSTNQTWRSSFVQLPRRKRGSIPLQEKPKQNPPFFPEMSIFSIKNLLVYIPQESFQKLYKNSLFFSANSAEFSTLLSARDGVGHHPSPGEP